MHTEYAERKHGRRPVEYPHEDLRDILDETYGVMVYQEQVMQTAVRMAGYTMSEADNLRKVMGKKKPELLPPHKEAFVNGAVERGIRVPREPAVRSHRAVRRLRVQRFARVRVRLRRVPDRVLKATTPSSTCRPSSPA